MTGSIVLCCTLASMRRTTGPPRWIRPRTGGLSFSDVPRPGAPASLRRRPSRPFWPRPWVGPCGRPRRKPRRSPPRPPASPPGSGPPDRGAAVRSWPEHRTGSASAPGRSAGREVQTHKVEAEHPHPQRLMVSGQHCPGEVVETPGARLAPIALPMRLGVIAPVADHRIAAAAGTAYTLAPALLAYQREALGIVQQGREIDQIDGWHDGGGSSHEPVSYSRSRLQARPPSAPRLSPDPTTLNGDKSLRCFVGPETHLRLPPT